MLEVAFGYSLGLLQGMRHALEPDHVAAVSTMLAEQRSARASVRFAVAWGAGHGVTLLIVGGLLSWRLAGRPLAVGLMHGLAGSGALAAMVMAQIPSLLGAIGFLALYGLGATCGMAALAGVAGVPLARIVRLRRAPAVLMAVTGAVSIGLGGVWSWPLLGSL
jgi:hypothetical protein